MDDDGGGGGGVSTGVFGRVRDGESGGANAAFAFAVFNRVVVAGITDLGPSI